MSRQQLTDIQRGWLEHVEACLAGDSSMKAYAERHGLDLQNFYLWKGRLKKLGLVATSGENCGAATTVVPVAFRSAPQTVRLAAPLGATTNTRIELANGIIIEAPAHIDADTLCDLLCHALNAS